MANPLFPSAAVITESTHEGNVRNSLLYCWIGNSMNNNYVLPVSPHDPSVDTSKGWLSNTSYQPAPLSHAVTHEDKSPPPKKIKENKQQREKESKKGKLSTSVSSTKPRTNWFDDCGLAPQEAYRVDSGSDHANLQYNALYSGDIATYRRRFGGQCVGLGSHQAIEWTDNRGKTLAKKNKEKRSRYFSLHLPQNESCLYLGSRTHYSDTRSSKRTNAPFFMALESGAANLDDDDKSGETRLTSEVFMTQQTAAFNKALQEDPHNISLWLEFLEFQPMAHGQGGGGEETKFGTLKSRRVLNERKLAIFERALEHNPLSEDLHVGELELLRDMDTEPGVIIKKWKDLVFRMPNKPLLWLKYSEFCRMQFSTFSLSSLTTLYQKSIRTLTAILEGVMKSHHPELGTPDHLLTLFVQFCHCLSAAGQNERAIACYQALIEYNLCCPSNIALSADGSNHFKQKIAFFEPFWDSDAPRLGENGAVGWKQWMKASESHEQVKPLSFIDANFLSTFTPSSDVLKFASEQSTDPELNLIAGHSLTDAWLILEDHRQKIDSLPFRGPDDEISDPERAVLFEDVSQCMFTIDNADLQLKLVLQYLQFLGVGRGAPCLDTLPHLISSHLHCAHDVLSCPGGGSSWVKSSTFMLHPHHICGVSSGYRHTTTSDLLFPHTHHAPPLSPTMCSFISNTCNQLLCLLPQLEAQTAVALEWVQFQLSIVMPCLSDPAQCKNKDIRLKTKAIQKLIKSLLKHDSHRNNLYLWDCCAQLELLLVGNREAATLYETVLSQYSIVTPSLLPLYQHYCELLLGLNQAINLSTTPTSHLTSSDTSHALLLMACVAEGKYIKPSQSLPPSHVLRVRHLYEQKSTSDISSCYLICCAYFEYLTRDIIAACKVFDNFTSAKLNQLPSSSLASDNEKHRNTYVDLHTVYCHQLNLLLCHADHASLPPTLIWSALDQALTTFPNDPYFFTVYTDSQQPLYLMGKLRKYFDTRAPKAQTAMPWIHAVRAEVLRYKRVTEGDMEASKDVPAGLVNRIRALLNRAIQSVNGRGCPLLWRLVISFEVCLLSI